MRNRLSLTKKTLFLALANVVVLAVLFTFITVVRFQGNIGSLLTSSVHDELVDLSNRFTKEYETTAAADRDALVARYRKESGLDLYLFSVVGGEQVAGPPITLPQEVQQQFQRLAPAAASRFGLRGVPPGFLPGPPGPPGGSGPPAGGPAPLRSTGGSLPEPLYVKASGPIKHWVTLVMLLRSPDGFTPSAFVFAFPSLLRSPLATPIFESAGIIAFGVLASVLCWVPFVRGIRVSIGKMEHATEEIAGGRFDVNIGVKRGDEIGLLANAIGRMASRLENFVKGQRRFFGDIAHELRSPIGRMRVALELVEQDASDERQMKHLAMLQREIDVMSEITDQFMTLARSELRHLELQRVRVAEIVDRVVQIENDSNAEIRVNVDSDLEAIAQPDYLFRSLSNLLRNSLRYAGGAGPIEVSAQRNNGVVQITVADSGPGVPEQQLEKIFEPFYRLDDSRDRRTGGTGLGLAIVRSCTEACEGSIEATNRTPHGLAVTIKLKTPSEK